MRDVGLHPGHAGRGTTSANSTLGDCSECGHAIWFNSIAGVSKPKKICTTCLMESPKFKAAEADKTFTASS